MTLVGTFVAGGIILTIFGLVLLGAGSFSKDKPSAMAYFDDSVSGLDIGAPVKFRGVSVGKISKVLLRTPGQSGSDYAVPVVMEFTPDLLTRRGLDQAIISREGLDESIQKGLRAKLQQQSVITGVLYVELDYFPDTKINLHDGQGELPEIPTLPSNLGALTKAVSQTLDQLSRIDFMSMTKKVDSILGKIDQGASSIQFERIGGNLASASESLAKLAGDPALTAAVKDFSAAMKGIESLSVRLGSKVDPIAEDLGQMAVAGRSALARLDEAAANIKAVTKPGSPLRRDVDQALEDVAAAAQAIRSLADFLERNPETVLTGRRNPDVPAPASKDGRPEPVEQK